MQEKNPIHLPTLGQFLLGTLGFLTFFSAAVGLAIVGTLSLASPVIQGGMQALPFFSLAWTSGLMSLLMIPSLIFPILRMLGKPISIPRWNGKIRIASGVILAFVWIGATTAGSFLENHPLNWLFLPPLMLLAIGIPLIAYLAVGTQKLDRPRPQRNWGLVAFGSVVAQPIILIAEFVLIGVMLGVGVIWVASQPDLLTEIERLVMRMASAQADPAALMRILTPYLENPRVIFIGIAFSAGLVPLLEELLKPLGLWLFVKEGFTPSDGFKMGLISGAVFALAESLSSISSISSGWGELVIGRAGTGLLHMVTSSLVGWGLAVAWREKKYIKLGAAYFAAAILHGIWNVFGLLGGLAEFLKPDSLASRLGGITPLVLGVLMVILFAILIMGNRILRKEENKEPI